MIRPTRVIGRGLFGGLVVAALGFGASQAVAEPVPAAENERCTSETHSMCRENCIAEGSEGGRCIVQWGVTMCECY